MSEFDRLLQIVGEESSALSWAACPPTNACSYVISPLALWEEPGRWTSSYGFDKLYCSTLVCLEINEWVFQIFLPHFLVDIYAQNSILTGTQPMGPGVSSCSYWTWRIPNFDGLAVTQWGTPLRKARLSILRCLRQSPSISSDRSRNFPRFQLKATGHRMPPSSYCMITQTETRSGALISTYDFFISFEVCQDWDCREYCL